jgi:hypothetical protein
MRVFPAASVEGNGGAWTPGVASASNPGAGSTTVQVVPFEHYVQNKLIIQGNVGIGTTAPGHALDVQGSDGYINAKTGLCINGTCETSVPSGGAVGGSGSSGYDALWNGGNTLTTGLLYETGGNVGIGTAGPGATLEVNGTTKLDNTLSFSQSNPTISAPSYVVLPNGMYINGSSPLYLETGAQLRVRSSISNDTGATLYISGGSSGYTDFNGGNVGIGITNPGEPLDVSGIARASGEIISTMASGSGQFRMVNGNYGAFWRNDGSNTYLLLTASGSPYAGWNGLRPFYVNDASGYVDMQNGVGITGGLSTDTLTTSGAVNMSAGAVTATNAGNVIYATYSP